MELVTDDALELRVRDHLCGKRGAREECEE